MKSARRIGMRRMTLPKALTASVFVCSAFFVFGNCTDAGLYSKGAEINSADRVGFKGRVCTEDPQEAGFPVRVLFLVDIAAGPLFSTFDPRHLRLAALREALAIHAGNASLSFAVAGFGPRPRLLAPGPDQGYFTRNSGLIDNAVATLSLAQGCVGEICRDYRESLSLARSVIEGDINQTSGGTLSRTQYVIVYMVAGPPSPLSCSYECCDDADDDCDRATCNPSHDCTKVIMREEVADLRDDIEKKGAAALSFHVMYLAASDNSGDDSEQNKIQRTSELLAEMAFGGAGRYERFDTPEAITLNRIQFQKVSNLFKVKSLMVSNANVLPGLGKTRVDSDGDGLADEEEKALQTDPQNSDSDGDGLGDLVELLLAYDPLVADDTPSPCANVSGPPFADTDGDLLNDCEEILFGTDPTLTDSDGDSLIDWTEVLLSTDYLRPDALADDDGDGSPNGEEAQQHTDPRSSDGASHLGDAYRYDITNEGLQKEATFIQPRVIQGVTILNAGADSPSGIGRLRYSVNPPRIEWQDPKDASGGPRVEISEAGEYQLLSQRGDVSGAESWISIKVEPQLLPPYGAQEPILIEWKERSCLSFVVRNIRLAETVRGSGDNGRNDIFIFFGEAPANRLTLPGPFRVAHIPIVYHPEKGRDPSDLLVEVSDDEFIPIGF